MTGESQAELVATPAADRAGAAGRRWITGPPALAVAAALVAVVTGAAVAWWGGAVLAAGWGGTLVDTGWTPWLLPACRLLVDASAVVTVGFLLAAAFLVPGRREAGEDGPLLLSPAGLAWVRAAGGSAAVWAVAAVASLCFT